jgi:hypothetical protein
LSVFTGFQDSVGIELIAKKLTGSYGIFFLPLTKDDAKRMPHLLTTPVREKNQLT